MRKYFNESELKDLCYYLNIAYEDLPAQGRAAKARELILACERLGRIPDLIGVCQERRPRVTWPDTARPLSRESLLGQADKRLPYEPEMVPVAAGPFLMGSLPGDEVSPAELPQHEVNLPFYYIGKTPVTNAQYAEFIKQQKQQDAPQKVGWFLRQPPPDKLDHPVVSASWHDALAYCQWLSQLTGRTYRLPGEAEWEKAARGNDGRRYPWGEAWQQERCNASSDGTTPVTAYSDGASPYGCLDMAGNVQEWTSTIWGGSAGDNNFPYPYQAGDGREALAADTFTPAIYRVHRGGAYRDDRDQLRCSARASSSAAGKVKWRGFRVALSFQDSPGES